MGIPANESEAFRLLVAEAKHRARMLPAPIVAQQALRAASGGDWPLQTAAFEAILRRIAAAERDALNVERRPPRGRTLGDYRTGGAGGVRPYLTRLDALDPLRASCGCPDFLRASLGLCKHIATTLADVYSDARRAERARDETTSDLPELSWDPIRPLLGPGAAVDRFEVRGSALPRSLIGWFAQAEDRWVVKPNALDAAGERAALDAVVRRLVERRSLRVTPAVAALLTIERSRSLLTPPPKVGAKIPGFKRKLYGYQRQGVAAILGRARFVLADDMGLGKTSQAIAASHLRARAGLVTRGLVVVPAALRGQWLREWEDCSDVPAFVFDGGPEERRRGYRSVKRGFVIVGYEQLVRDFEALLAFAPDMVVLDEAQRIKNWATKRARTVKRLDAQFRLVLTGTPFENRLEELGSILDWVDDFAIEPKWRLEPFHIKAEGDGGPGRHGAKNLDTLRTRLEGVLLRRTRQQVLGELPPRTDTTISVPMTEEQRARHDDLDLPIAKLLRQHRQRPLTPAQVIRLLSMLATQRIISNGVGQQDFEQLWPALKLERRPSPSLLESVRSPKLLELRELIEQVAIGQRRKVVVFSEWRNMLRLSHWAIGDLLDDEGLRAVFFTGAENTALRERSLVEFHDDPNTRIMFLTDAGGVGLNLQRAATCCVNLELPWNPAVLEQRIGRIHRIGQTEPIDVYNLRSEHGIEERIARLVQSKRALFVGLFDGASDELDFDRAAGFLAQLERILPEEPDDDPASEAEEPAGPAPVEPSPPAPARTAPATASSNRANELLAGLSISKGDDGAILLHAPPEAAELLSTAFEVMAKLLRQGASRGE